MRWHSAMEQRLRRLLEEDVPVGAAPADSKTVQCGFHGPLLLFKAVEKDHHVGRGGARPVLQEVGMIYGAWWRWVIQTLHHDRKSKTVP